MKENMSQKPESEKKCFLCGKKRNLIRTECCNQWICNDEHKYILFSYANNSCSRNHRRFTLCSHHHQEGHSGKWQNCNKCKEDFETEFYVYYGTNEYNYEVLKNPPSFELKKCIKCNTPIDRANEDHTETKEGIICNNCLP